MILAAKKTNKKWTAVNLIEFGLDVDLFEEIKCVAYIERNLNKMLCFLMRA